MKNIKKLLTIGFVIICICGSLTACSKQDNTVSEQITTINATIMEMQTLDTTLGGYIDTLESKVVTLETDLTAVNTALENWDENSATKTALAETKTALENEINTIKADITALKAKDIELDGKITTLKTALSTEITDTEKWVSDTFATKRACETLKMEINATISTLQGKISGLETSISTLSASVTALQEQIQQNKEDIDELKTTVNDLQIQINCLKGKHVADDSKTQYKWADDFTTCEASSPCLYCRTQIREMVTTTWVEDRFDYYLAQFSKYGFEERTDDGQRWIPIHQGSKETFENVGVIENVGTKHAGVRFWLKNYETYDDMRLEIDAGGKMTLKTVALPLMEYATTNGCVYSLETDLLISGDLTLDDGKTTYLGGSWFTNYTGGALTIIDNRVTATLTGEQSFVYMDDVTFKNGTITCVVNDNNYCAYFVLPANESIDVTTVFEGETYINERITSGSEDCKYYAFGDSIDIIQGSLTIDGAIYTVHPSERESIIYFCDGYVRLLRNVIINDIEFTQIGYMEFCVKINADGSFTVFENSVKITLDAGETAIVNGQTYSGGENGATLEIIVK